MATIARRIVSGQKARFKDPNLDVDLDLTYVTDHVIIMGFPASGVQSFYRNKRSQVRRFLDKRHDDLYRVYNFCPVTENSYDPDEFYGRVSRFPFPDHHVPPLSLIPLFVADVTEWLESDPDAVAVIHCKAGKGRSGTMTCCYLVSLPYLPTPPTSMRNYSEMKKPDKDDAAASSTTLTPLPLSTTSGLGSNNASTLHLGERAASSVLAPERSSSLLQIPRSVAAPAKGDASRLGNGSPTYLGVCDDAIAPRTLRRKPSLAPHQSIIHNCDHDPELEIQQISQRLQTIFDLHTQRRMKPQTGGKGSVSARKRSKSNAVSGLKPSACSTGGMPSAATSSYDLRTLGARPAGRSCDALHTMNMSTMSFATHDPDASASTMAFGGGYGGGTGVGNVHGNYGDGDASLSTALANDSFALNQNTEDHAESAKPRMGVSIPSQRRWVGYWTRILSGRDPRVSMTTLIRQPRRQIRITRISVDRSTPQSGKSAQGFFEKLVPHSDALSIQLMRYNDDFVDRLEHWERQARRRAKAFGQNDPSGHAADLDAEEQAQRQYLKTLRRKASDLKCWDGKKFSEEHESKIGNWGIHTKGEAERARNFDWQDDHPQLEYFSLIAENKSGRGDRQRGLVRYTFEPRGQDGKGRNASTSSADSGYYSASSAAVQTEYSSFSMRSSRDAGEAMQQMQMEERDTHLVAPETNGRSSRLGKLSRKASGYFGRGARASPSSGSSSVSSSNVTPPSAAAYPSAASGELAAGQILDADREVCVKVLVGKTGNKHAKLPDVASAGWCWFIPSFEDPITGTGDPAVKGAKTKIRFERDEIDFRKQPLGVTAIEVEWEWVSVGIDD
ncbi:hypothetical protein BCV70DRAFT_145910, partial [Testicularia cyperi]